MVEKSAFNKRKSTFRFAPQGGRLKEGEGWVMMEGQKLGAFGSPVKDQAKVGLRERRGEGERDRMGRWRSFGEGERAGWRGGKEQ